MTPGRRLFVVCYTLSGAAALAYEVTWTRLLTLQLGHTVAAASTVLAAFMGGLAIGAWIAGVLPPRDRAWSLRAYAALEVSVAIFALAIPFALRAAIPLLASAYADGSAPALFAFVRIGISLLLVGIPAAAMGATFPIAAGAMVTSSSDAGILYAANTAGAATGAIAAGFVLIPALGLTGTTWVGVALNLAAAAGALWLSARAARNAEPAPAAEKDARTRSRKTSRTGSPTRSQPRLASAAAAVSGFSALVYEVAWTRLIALVIGPTTYAFATMAASFISGLAIGSAVGTRIARRTRQPTRWLGAVLAVGAAAAVASAWFAATDMPLTVAAQVSDPSADFDSIVWRQAFAVGIVLLPMTLTLGAAFPLALAVAGQGPVARVVAHVYTANTLGAIAGALAAGFMLVPSAGLRDSIRIAALLASVMSAALLIRPRDLKQSALPGAVALALSLGAILLTPPWDRALLASGAYKYAPYLGSNDLEIVLRAGSISFYKEGAAATVSVKELAGVRSLAIDGKVDASNGGDMLTQRLLGLLPVLLHGNAEDVAVIGLGSGVTAGSALAAGSVRRLDVVEISPEVVEASHFFDKESGNALARPGVRLIVGDGRSHLLLTPRSYDVIVSEPSNPWMAGVASLFTRQFFEAARARLNAGGLLCQWAHTYDISGDDLRSIVNTFATVFPQGTMWLVGGGDLLLIGARDGSVISRLAALEAGARKATTAAALTDVGVSPGTAPFALLSLFAGGPRELQQFGAGALVQTDDRTALEYSAPRGIYGRTREDNAAAIRGLDLERPPIVRDAIAKGSDGDWTSRGAMDLRAQAFASAYDAFRKAITLNGHNAVALAGFSDAAGGVGRLPEARDWLRRLATEEPSNVQLHIELSRLLAVTGDTQGAVRAASEALELAPDDPRAAEQLASVLADAGDAERLGAFTEAMLKRFPDRVDARYYRASALFLNGKTEDAVTVARQVVDANPDHARAQSVLASACATLGKRECALAAFQASIRGNPRDPAGYINAGDFSLQIADARAAADYFASALAIDPSSAAAKSGLAQARALLAQTSAR